jgi:hypothetical protein
MRYAIRQLRLGEVLDQAIKVSKDHFGVFLGIVGVLLIPFTVVVNLLQVTMAPELPPNATPEQQLEAARRLLGLILPIQLISVYIIAPITNAALIFGISDAYLGKPVSIGESFKKAFRRILPLIGTWILVGLAIMGGFILCVVPGILAAFWFSLATQVVVVEGVGGVEAMKRSKRLMAGNIGSYFVLLLLIGLVTIGLYVAASLIPQPHAQAVATAVVEGVAAIFTSAAVVVFYFSARCKHEHFDLKLLAESVGSEAPGKPATVDTDLQ